MRKGFTLIELLAVIVILAIIAVIAVPIVIDIIEDTKINSVKISASMYLKATKLYISNAELNKIKINPGAYSITKDGNICIGIIEEDKCNGEIIKIDVKGSKPTSGKIIINDKNIQIEYLEISGYTYYKENDEYIVEKTTRKNIESDNGIITLNSSTVPALSNYRIYGNSYQETRSGKNIADPKQIEKFVAGMQALGDSRYGKNTDIVIDENGRRVLKLYAPSGYGHENYDELVKIFSNIFKENTQYTISFNYYRNNSPVSSATNLAVGYTDGTYKQIYCNDDQNDVVYSCTHITEKNKSISYIFLIFYSGYTNVYLDTLQIEEGTTATEYEKYIVSPSPEFPSEIQSVGDLVTDENHEYCGKYEIPIRVTGKNLMAYPYDSSTFSSNGVNWMDNGDGTITVSGTATDYSVFSLGSISFLPNTTYTVSGIYDTTNISLTLSLKDAQSTTLAVLQATNVYSSNIPYITFNTADYPAAVMGQLTAKRQNNDVVNGVIKPLIELGNKTTEYESYIKPITANIYLDEPLRCIGEVCDYLDYGSGKVVRYIEELDNDSSKSIEENFEVLTMPIIEKIELPKIKINEGVSNIFIETDIKPSKVSVNYYK